MNKIIFAALVSLLTTQSAVASFSENSRRYLSPKDMAALLVQKFPVLEKLDVLQRTKVASPGTVPASCWAVGVRNGNASGLSLPAIGAPATTTPGAAFVRWWGSCADMIIAKQIEVLTTTKATDEALWQKYWTTELLNKYRDKKNASEPFHKFDKIPWSDLTVRQREMQTRFLIEEMIGPNGVIRDLGFVNGIDQLSSQIVKLIPDDSPLKLNAANRVLMTAITLREEFITY